MTGRVLLLSPSWGHGREIERYTATVECAFAAEGVKRQRLDLSGSGARAHARLLAGWRGRVGTLPSGLGRHSLQNATRS
jgi:hypothetical protein